MPSIPKRSSVTLLAALMMHGDAESIGPLLPIADAQVDDLVNGEWESQGGLYRAVKQIATDSVEGAHYVQNLRHSELKAEAVDEVRWAEMDAAFTLGLAAGLRLSGRGA